MKIVKALWPLLISAPGSVGLALLARSCLKYEGLTADVSAWGSFFNVFGVIYAITTGFLLLNVLNRYSAIAQVCEEELNAVECIRDFLVYLDDRQAARKQEVNRALLEYVRSVSDKEWAEMSSTSGSLNSDTSKELYQIMRSCKEVEVSRENENAALASVMDSVSELTRLRTRRISLSNERLPIRLRILVVFMSSVLVLGFALLGVVSPWVHVLVIVSMAASVHLLHRVLSVSLYDAS